MRTIYEETTTDIAHYSFFDNVTEQASRDMLRRAQPIDGWIGRSLVVLLKRQFKYNCLRV